MIIEKLKACFVSNDDGSNANSIQYLFPPSRFKKWKRPYLKKLRAWTYKESQQVYKRIVNKHVSILYIKTCYSIKVF